MLDTCLETCCFLEFEEADPDTWVLWLRKAGVEDAPEAIKSAVRSWIIQEREQYNTETAQRERERERARDRWVSAFERSWDCESFNDFQY